MKRNILNIIKKPALIYLLAAYCTLCTSGAVPQQEDKGATVSGTVTDAATGKPMAGVIVGAYGNNRYTAMTDEKGHYELLVPAYVTSLSMQVDGYNMLQTPIGANRSDVNGRLYTVAFSKDYATVTEAQRKITTGGFSNTADLSIDGLIQQRLGADVRSVSRGGNAGLGNVMLVNGINSFQGNAQPLIVVDGVIMDMQYSRSILHQGYYNNLLANINVNDIEDVTVLKNGTAIYGAKGANGVLLINTKRNKSMATRIDVTINGSYQLMPRLPEMMGAEDYRLYASELLYNQCSDISRLKFLATDPNYYYYKQYHNSTDWKDETYRNAFMQNYGINVQGGDDVANYNLSVGYSMGNSTLRGNDYTRFDMRLNTDIDIFRQLSVRFDASYSDVNRSLLDDGVSSYSGTSLVTSPGFLGLIKSPFLSPYAYDTSGNLSGFLSQADDYLTEVFGNTDASLANPSSILEYGDGENRNSFGNRMIMLSITPRYEFNKHLSLSEHFNFTLVNTNENYYLPLNGVPKFQVSSISETEYFNNMVGSLAGRQSNLQSDTRLTWSNRYGAHGLNVFGGVRYLSTNYKLSMQRGYDTGNDKTPNMSSSLKYKSTEGADDKSREITWYGQADYNYSGKYYLMAGLSAQTSSRFGENADGLDLFGTVWGIFPSVQAAWVATNEKWMSTVKAVDYLRFSLGYDVSGNDDIDYTASRTYFSSHTMIDNSVSGKELANIGNDKLKWETTRRITAGLDGRFFDNRLSLRFNYFKSWTSDLITLHPLAWTSGLNQNWGNGGKLENNGFDVSAAVKVLNLKDWKWEVGASVGHYKNKLTALPDNNKSIETTLYGATVLSQVGQPVGLFYGYRTDGVLSTEQEASDAALYQLDKSGRREYFQAGDMRFVDSNDDNCIAADDRQVIGDPNPDIYGNISTSLNWKKWRLDMTFNYSLGNDIYNYQRSLIEGGSLFYNQTTAMNNRWTTEGQRTDIPRANYQDPMGNSRFSDRWIEDGSFLKLKNVTLSYTLPIMSTYLQGITVWCSAQNLFTITKYLGSDPDCISANGVLYQGIDTGILAAGRTFSLGVKINL